MSKSNVPAMQRTTSATRRIAVSALLCALNVVFARFFTVMPSAISRFSIEAVPVVLAGYFFGPISGMMVGFVGDTVGCLFSPYGWDPILSISPMLLGLFSGLLRSLVYSAKKPWDIWRVILTILPAKALGSVYWTSQCLIWLGFSKKSLGALMSIRAVEAGIELLIDSVIVMLLLMSKVFARIGLFPPKHAVVQKKSVVALLPSALLLLQIAVLIVGSLTVGLRFSDNTYSVLTRCGWAILYFIPLIVSILLFFVSECRKSKSEKV